MLPALSVVDASDVMTSCAAAFPPETFVRITTACSASVEAAAAAAAAGQTVRDTDKLSVLCVIAAHLMPPHSLAACRPATARGDIGRESSASGYSRLLTSGQCRPDSADNLFCCCTVCKNEFCPSFCQTATTAGVSVVHVWTNHPPPVL